MPVALLVPLLESTFAKQPVACLFPTSGEVSQRFLVNPEPEEKIKA